MVIENKTHLDGREVRGIIARVAKDLEVEEPLRKWFTIQVTNTVGGGDTYTGCFSANRMLVILRLNHPEAYPLEEIHGYKLKDVPPGFMVENWQEALAAIAGHELMHLRQWDKMRKGIKGNHRGKYNEVETQFAEYRAWQREHARTLKRVLSETQVSSDT
jgi:hypothetical protein